MQDHVTPEALEDGTTLLILKMKYLQSGGESALYAFLNCLRDSSVFVPVNVVLSGEDQQRVRNVKAGDTFESRGAIRMRPDFLTSRDGRQWFPIFSQAEQLPDQYKTQFSLVRIDMLQCIQTAHASSELSGLVLDAFTKAAVLLFDIADLIPQIPSQLESET